MFHLAMTVSDDCTAIVRTCYTNQHLQYVFTHGGPGLITQLLTTALAVILASGHHRPVYRAVHVISQG